MDVFEAGNSPVITFIQKVKATHKVKVDIFSTNYQIRNTVNTDRSVLKSDNWGPLLSENLDVVTKILSQAKRVNDYCLAENPFSVSEAYEVKELIRDLNGEKYDSKKHFRFINTGTIDRYISLWGLVHTTYLKNKYLKPVIERKQFATNFPRRFSQSSCSKLVISGIRHFECVFDSEGEYVAGKSTTMLKSRSNEATLKSVMGILNSKLITFYIKESYGSMGIDGGINFTTNLVENLPLPHLENIKLDKFILCVDKLIESTTYPEESPETQEYNRRIDEFVYDFYKLTPDEIKVIEKRLQKKKA